jgi:hypothetical protein
VCAGRSVTDDLRPEAGPAGARQLRRSGLDAELVAFRVRHDDVVWAAARHGGAEPFQPGHLIFHRTGGTQVEMHPVVGRLGLANPGEPDVRPTPARRFDEGLLVVESSSTSDPSTAAQNLASASASAASKDTDLTTLGILGKVAAAAMPRHLELPAWMGCATRGHISPPTPPDWLSQCAARLTYKIRRRSRSICVNRQLTVEPQRTKVLRPRTSRGPYSADARTRPSLGVVATWDSHCGFVTLRDQLGRSVGGRSGR